MVFLVPLKIRSDGVVYVPTPPALVHDFVSDPSAWRVHPAKATSPHLRKLRGLDPGGGMAWQLSAPIALLRASLENRISLTVDDMSRLLRLEGVDVPSPPRRGDVLYALLAKVFNDWEPARVHAHWESMLTEPTAQQRAAADLDEDVVQCMKHHMTQQELADYPGYVDALDEREKAERLARKRPREAAGLPRIVSSQSVHVG